MDTHYILYGHSFFPTWTFVRTWTLKLSFVDTPHIQSFYPTWTPILSKITLVIAFMDTYQILHGNSFDHTWTIIQIIYGHQSYPTRTPFQSPWAIISYIKAIFLVIISMVHKIHHIRHGHLSNPTWTLLQSYMEIYFIIHWAVILPTLTLAKSYIDTH